MDDDVENAISGDRLGLAIKKAKEREALHRGCMIVHAESNVLVKNLSSTFAIDKAPFQKRILQVGDVIHAAVDMQFVVGRIKIIDQENVTVDWDIPLGQGKQFTENNHYSTRCDSHEDYWNYCLTLERHMKNLDK